MTLRSALVALAALALVGCAPLAVGGEWRTGAPVQREGWTISNASLRFDASGSVEVTVSAAPSAGGCAPAVGTMRAKWFVNANGQTVAHDGACTSEPVQCGASQAYPCRAAGALVTIYNDRGGALVSADGAVVLTR